MHRSGAVMAWNVFKFCTALRGLGSLMIVLVLSIIGVTYYAVVITNYGPVLLAGGLDSLIAVIVVLLFHALVSCFGGCCRCLLKADFSFSWGICLVDRELGGLDVKLVIFFKGSAAKLGRGRVV